MNQFSDDLRQKRKSVDRFPVEIGPSPSKVIIVALRRLCGQVLDKLVLISVVVEEVNPPSMRMVHRTHPLLVTGRAQPLGHCVEVIDDKSDVVHSRMDVGLMRSWTLRVTIFDGQVTVFGADMDPASALFAGSAASHLELWHRRLQKTDRFVDIEDREIEMLEVLLLYPSDPADEQPRQYSGGARTLPTQT